MGLLGASRHATHQAALSGDWQGLLKRCAVEIVIFGLPVGIGLWISRTTRDDLMLRCRGWLRLVALGTAYSIAIRLALAVFLTVLCTALIVSHLATPATLQTFAQANRPEIETVVNVQALKHDRVYFWLTVTFVSFVVAGLREELWRAASLTALGKLWPGWFGAGKGRYAAVLVTSCLFGLGHLPQGVLAIGATTLIGIALGGIMISHRSTWLAVIAHGMFDATSFVLIAAFVDKMPPMP